MSIVEKTEKKSSSEYGNTRQAAAFLNVSVSFLNKARVYGNGPPYVKFGANVRYHKPTLLKWAQDQTCGSTS